ncbi:NACHT domain-containing protein [Actinosynnema sp. NPDC059797]
MARLPSATTVMVVTFAIALVGNMATNTVSVNKPWWPFLTWGTVVGLIAWVIRAERGGRRDADHDDLPGVVDRLAAVVRKQWLDEIARQPVNDPRPLRVRWDPAPADLVASWADITRLAVDGVGGPGDGDRASWAASAGELAGSDLLAVWRKVPTRRLVVLGGPGTGKTVLLAGFVIGLLNPKTRVKGSPVPVLVSVASWNPDDQDLPTWLAERLAVDHPALARRTATGTSLLRLLLDEKLIIMVLDGLDEIPAPLRARAVVEMNKVLAGGVPLVVSSRTDAYRDATRPPNGAEVTLTGAAGIRLRPLDVADVISYLRSSAGSPRHAPRWDRVAEALARGGPLARTLATPLMTTLAGEVHNPHRDATPTTDLPNPDLLVDLPDREAIERHLFDGFISAAYRPHPTRPTRWRAEQARQWLGYLAFHLERHRGGRPDLAWWRLHLRTGPRSPSWLAGWAVGALAALAAGVAATSLYSAAYSSNSFGWTGLTVCVTAYLVFGSVWWLTGRFGAALTASAVTAVAGGLAIDLVGDLSSGPTTPVLMIAAGFASGLAHPLREAGRSAVRAGALVGLTTLVVYTALYSTHTSFPTALNAASVDAALTGLLVLVSASLAGARAGRPTGRALAAFAVAIGALRGTTAWFAGEDWLGTSFTNHEVVVAISVAVVDAALAAVVLLVALLLTGRGSRRDQVVVCLLVVLVAGANHSVHFGFPAGVTTASLTAVCCLFVRPPVAAGGRSLRPAVLGIGVVVVAVACAFAYLPDAVVWEVAAPATAAIVVIALGDLLARRDHQPRDWLRVPLRAGLGYGVLHALYYGPVDGLAVGVVVGLAVELVDRRLRADVPAEGLRLTIRGLLSGVPVAVVVSALLIWRYDVLTSGLLALVVGAAVGLAYGMEVPRGLTAVRTPAQVLARDRAVFLVTTAVVALAVAVAVGFVSGTGAGFDVVTGLVGGLTHGVVTGVLVAAGRTRWPRWFVTRCALALTKRVPWRLMTFLEDAHAVHGVLRQNGATYQFRHLEVQRRLAATWAAKSAPRGTAGTPAATPRGSARPSPRPTR